MDATGDNITLTAPVEIAAAAAAEQDAAAQEAAGRPFDSAQGRPFDSAQSQLPRFHMVAYTGGVMRISGWRGPVVVDLAGLTIPAQSRPIRFGHDANSGVGHTDSIRVEAGPSAEPGMNPSTGSAGSPQAGSGQGRLVATGVVSRDTAAAREVVASARNGFPWQASIGTTVEKYERIRAGQRVQVNGRTLEGPLTVVRRATLGEISFVDLGADGESSARIAAKSKHNASHTNMEAEAMEDKHTTQATEPQEQPGEAPRQADPERGESPEQQPDRIEAGAAGAAGGNGGGTLRANSGQAPRRSSGQANAAPTAGSQDDPVTDLRARAAAEQERIHAIREVCGDAHTDIAARAIGEGWDRTRCELEVLRAERPKPPAAHVPETQMTGQILEAACMLTGGVRGDDVARTFGEPAVEAAESRFRGGIGLQELLLEAAWANGYSGRNFRDSRAVLRHAFGPDLQAGFSTLDIGGILSNVANKFLLEGFFSVERTWRDLCAVRNVSDFKTVTSYRLIGRDQYEQVAPGGELKHGTLGEESYANKADTYGLLLSIDRRDIINDDLGAITTVPRKLGRGSGLKINDVFWTVFLANSGFFKAGNKNYLTGAGTALGIDALTDAEVAFDEQTDSDGKPIGIMPQILLVPTGLSALATMLYKSLEIRDTAADTKYPVANPHQGKFRTAVSRYLSNSNYTGHSDKAWYLLADPQDLPVIEVAFLNGQESPTIETAEADFNVLGVQMRGYHDFGVALQDPKGGVKCKGEA